jgi:ribosomal protein S1
MNDPQHSTPESSWQQFLRQQCARTPIEGVVTKVVSFGAFIRLHEGVDGLLHRSEWSGEPQVGSPVTVRVLDLDLANRRVSLGQA